MDDENLHWVVRIRRDGKIIVISMFEGCAKSLMEMKKRIEDKGYYVEIEQINKGK